MQTYALSSAQDMASQTLMIASNNLYVLQQLGNEPVEEALVAERSGEDLLLSFRSQEQSYPALTLERFFSNNGQVHVLHEDGQLVRNLSAQDASPQGPLNFTPQTLPTAEQQPEGTALGLLHRLMFPAAVASANQAEAMGLQVINTDLSPEVHQAAELPELSLMSITPVLANPPLITNALDQLGDRQGSLNSGSVTDDKFATLQGTGPAGAILEIFDGSEVIGEVKVDSQGNWSFMPEQSLDEGGHVLSAHVKGGGDSSNSFVLVVDSIAPSRVVIDSIVDDRDSGMLIAKNGYTADNTPVISGHAEAFSMVAIYVGKTLLGTSFADASGAWQFSSFFIMPDGEYSISAKAIDFSGNTGLASAAYKITVDTIPPAVPTILHAEDNVGALQGLLNSGALTDDRTPTLSGKAEAGVTVFIYDNGQLIGTSVTDANGDWALTPASDLNDGTHDFTAVARDLAGNLSTQSDTFELLLGADRTQTPTIGTVIDDVGSVVGVLNSGGHTDDTLPTLQGKATPGDMIRIYDNGTLIGETITDAQGDWNFTPTQELPEGPHSITVQAISGTQSPSELSPAFELVVDVTGPDASQLRITGVYDDEGSVTGNVLSGGRTDDHTPSVNGTGTAGDTVILYVTAANGTREVGRSLVDSEGKWSVNVHEALSFGQNTFTAVEIDAAGNATPQSPAYTVTISNDAVGGFDLNLGNSSTQINTTTQGEQSNPQVTRLTDGKLVVVWQQNTDSGYDVMMQLMDPTGTQKIGQEQFVNQRNLNNQDSPQVTALADGGYLVVWESYQASALDNNGDGVFARKYNADGSAQTDEFLVNQTIVGGQRAASTLGLPDGGYIISWYSDQGGQSIMQRAYGANNQPVSGEIIVKSGGAIRGIGGPEMALFEDPTHAGWYITVWNGAGNNNDVFGQLRKTDGSAAGPILTLNTTLDSIQNYPQVITLKNGSFVVFWDSNDSKTVGSDIRAAHYTFDPSSGKTELISGGDFIVNEYQVGKQYKPVGVALGDGGYMLFWGSDGGDGSGSAVYAQRFDASGQKLGHEFLVNSITQGNQGAGGDNVDITHILDAVLMENGNIFVTWQSDNIDGNGFGIEGLTIDIDAGFYSEFIVNTTTAGNQQEAVTAALPDGGFIVVWASKQGSNTEPMAQLFDSSGMPVGDEFHVSSKLTNSTVIPSVVALADGTFIIGWHNYENGRDVVHYQHFGYTYDETGSISGSSKIGADTTVDLSGYLRSRNATMTALEDGGFLIVWQAQLKNGQPWEVMARQYDANGDIIGNDTIIGKMGYSSYTDTPSKAVVTTLENGQVVITYGKDSASNDVYFRVFDPKNQSLGDEFLANQTTGGAQGSPTVAELSNGNFIVTWDSDNKNGPDQSGKGNWGRIFSPNGNALTDEFLINTFTPGDQKRPVAISRPGGGFVVVYPSQADTAPGTNTFGIYAQFFDDAGNRVGQEMRIHQLMSGDQVTPDVSFLADGKMFVSWTDTGLGDGSGSAIKGRIIDLDTTLGLGVSVDAGVSHQGLMLAAEHETTGSLWMLFDDNSTAGLLLTDESLSSVHGGSGNDVVGISDTSFTLISGGEGIDTLLLDGKNMTLDLNTLVDRITGIEKIDLGQGGSNSLSLSANALDGLGQTNLMLVDGKNQFVINGDASNSIQLKDVASESWMDAGQAEVNGVVYHAYVSGATELLVEESIHVTML
ncbi:hypothetical protein JFU48_25125 [Pseudomonas sp. TH49]|uniref:Ig-like domain-containing protein n=1 Tax=Pseudomonas sp. TH49 TaxID=2796413 RepID=UPI0019130A49|nr:Ig-like domain-containing protein [Pseudomonas sp. TH49]MBK5344651.1 hypothetical protein [Pseudomonas sp. TH49]